MGGQFFPEQIKRIASLAFTVLAAILYAGVLGAAIVRTLSGADAAFSSNMVRAVGLLSGLVGSVVGALVGSPVTYTHRARLRRAAGDLAGILEVTVVDG